MFCRKCGTENKDDAKFCRGCGSSLQAITTPVVSASPDQPVTSTSSAKQEVAEPQKITPAENNTVSLNEQVKPSLQEESVSLASSSLSSRKTLIIAIVAVTVIALAIVGVVFYKKHQTETATSTPSPQTAAQADDAASSPSLASQPTAGKDEKAPEADGLKATEKQKQTGKDQKSNSRALTSANDLKKKEKLDEVEQKGKPVQKDEPVQKGFALKTTFADGSSGPVLRAKTAKEALDLKRRWDNPTFPCSQLVCWGPDSNCNNGGFGVATKTSAGVKRIPPACVTSEAEAKRVVADYASKHGIQLEQALSPSVEENPHSKTEETPSGSEAVGYKVKFRGIFGRVVEKRSYPTEEMKRQALDLWDKEQKILEPDGSINEKYSSNQSGGGSPIPGH